MSSSQNSEAGWSELQQELNRFMLEWRRTHPRATLKEIELTLDSQMAVLRSVMLENLALDSPAAEQSAAAERTVCPDCGGPLQARGNRTRELITHHERTVRL